MKSNYKECIDCGKVVIDSEMEWCYECMMDIFGHDNPRALHLMEAKIPLAAQIFVAAHCEGYSPITLARADNLDVAVASYMVINSSNAEVRRMALPKASPRAQYYAIMTDTDVDVVKAGVAICKNPSVAESGKSRIKKLSEQDASKNGQAPS